ncbi:hypothetical protein LJC49_10470 [Ruminococcaceae bacterium OttesenSCG-928-I18]|nr:hypothetical protein [Ruminococcaceae bacterium OttesenSCG-928-I18]
MIISCRIDVMKNGAKYSELLIEKKTVPSINMRNQQDIKMELKVSFKNNDDIDFLNDRFIPYLILNGQEHQLGTYIAATAAKKKTEHVSRSMTAYDLTYLARISKIETPLSISLGSKYTDVIREQLVLSGITDFNIVASPMAVKEIREDWEPGENRLAIINELLKEINYNSLWMDLNGVVQVTPYNRPTIENVTQIYQANEYSILYQEHEQDFDIFERPNVFRLVCENPEKTLMVATSVNNDPASIISTINTGRRILYTEKLNNVADQSTLQNLADKVKFESLLSKETTEIQTGPNPTHRCFDIVVLQKDDIDGIFEESEWTINLGGTGAMKHKLRRLLLY